MTDAKTKMTFREHITLFAYGLSLVRKLTPAYWPCMLINSLISAIQPLAVLFFSARILNELSGTRDVRTIVIYASATVALTFLFSTSKALLTRETETIAGWERAFHRMKMMEAERFTQMDYVHAEDSKISEILARMDTQAMGNGLGLMNMYYQPAQAAAGIFQLLLSALLLFGPLSAGGIGGPWAWALYGIFALGLLYGIKYAAKQQAVLEDIYASNAKANTAAGFYMNYISAGQAAKDIRLYRQGDALLQIFRKSFNTKTWTKFFFFQGRIEGYASAVMAVVGGGLYLLGGYGALDGTVSVGGLVQSVGAVTAFSGALGILVGALGNIYNNAAFLKPMREFLSLPDILVKGTKPVPSHSGHAHQIEFRNVSFRYPETEEFALKDLNLKLNSGQRLAVVGLNGSGKTTMIKLLCRLYDPTEGEILLDGVNIKEYDYEQYTALFSVVFQDYKLFPLWLGQNVAAAEQYDAKRVNECLTGAGFSERLQKMPDKLDTVLFKDFDEDGTRISGGEAQKIALARALYKDAPLVVLDEPTAALDPIAEFEVYSTFDKTIGDKTAVFISHRLSSCRFCHDIAVFSGGHLVQRGTHDALLADTNGLYRELWDAQAKHYVD